MSGVVRGSAFAIPLRDESVDLVVTSPPYFGQRSYKDGGEHFDGQIGAEAHPQLFLDALWSVMGECWRVLKPSGSVFVNLGDKRSGSGAPGTTSQLGGPPQGDRTGMARSVTSGSEVGSTLEGRAQQRSAGHWARSDERNVRRSTSYTRAAFGRAKSRQMLPESFAIGCRDGLADPCLKDHEHVGRGPAWIESEMCRGMGWIVRQIIVWDKPNGLPESVKDRTRDNFEVWYHLAKSRAYYSSVDELREPHKAESVDRARAGFAGNRRAQNGANAGHHRTEEGWGQGYEVNPLGSLPGSVWRIATEPLRVPEHLGVDHFAAFPTEWPRRLILGWSPPGWCTACAEPLRPVVEATRTKDGEPLGDRARAFAAPGEPRRTPNGDGGHWRFSTDRAIVGYSCACPADRTPPETVPAVVLDPFGGTGTTAMVARALGRTGVSLDLSADYCRLARWRVFESGHGAKAVERTNRDRQGVLI